MPEKKKSLNPIPSTLRGKKRYVKFRLIVGAWSVEWKYFGEKEVWNEMVFVFGFFLGGNGIARQRLWLVKWFPETNEGIIRCALHEEENVKAGLLFLQKIGPASVIPIIVAVSGSVKKLKGQYKSMAGGPWGGTKRI